MISSTALDLPEHRKEILDACLRQGMLPLMMEHLPAGDAEAIETSLRMVDDADIYVGVFAHRYGYVPGANNPRDISITEMEYDHAVERKIPRLIFLIDKAHPITIDVVEQGEGAVKLGDLKSRLETEKVVNYFNSPTDLRAHVINSLSKLRQPDLNTFHYVSDIPAPPEPFIAHPYTLLQTHRLVGRQPELNLLTDWVARPDSPVYRAHILNVVAIGGLGKSALTWKWFNDIAPQEMRPLAGRLWWSFYESDATFENFVTRALAYVTRRPLAEVQQTPAPERESQLLNALDHEPFLLVLDGLERILIAYARMDAAHLSDDDYDRQTANYVANAHGLPPSAAQSFIGEHRLRKTADPRAGSFLRKLANVRASRILVSTRLYPAELQTITGEPLPGCSAHFLQGLADDNALELWRAFGVTGARDKLLPLFNSVGNHPLLIQALASEVSRYRPAPSDFDKWRSGHLDFDPFSLPLIQAKSHVLEYALRGLDDRARQTLQVIAAFRMPARYDTLAALLIGEGKACANEHKLDKVLTELEDRGVVGWDRRANRYDLHPIVRGVVWSGLGDDIRRGVYTSMHAHFEALPKISDWREVNDFEDLTPAIELYNTLIGLGRYDDAFVIFKDWLSEATLYRLSANLQRIELLNMLFPEGSEQLPRLIDLGNQGYTLNTLALGYTLSGQPRYAASLYRRACIIASEISNSELSIALSNLSDALRLSGALYESEAAARRALTFAQLKRNYETEGACLYWLGLSLGARGRIVESEIALNRSLKMALTSSGYEPYDYCAMLAFWIGAFGPAKAWADKALAYCQQQRLGRNEIQASRLQGESALGLNDLATADERLHYTLIRARTVSFVEEELPSLAALAELQRRQGDLKAAREFLDDVWDAAERGPYPLVHADACNVLAQIERDAGNVAEAVEAAGRAYRLAWCDGPPFAYHWGLEKARRHLRELGAGEPEMPPFDALKFEPMPEVEIDPEDEFHVGKSGGGEVGG
ncbi:MAG: hypothetical protein QOD28_1139 [Acidobacteriota bacterium]|nr:hypothetical protein [Acidobacteriota bacterium]